MEDYNKWTERDFLDDLWGKKVNKKISKKLPEYTQLVKTQCFPEFTKLANNRMVMGAFRYGLIEEQNFDDYDLIQECKNRLTLFENDGNLEHLIDAGNMIRIRFYWGRKKGEEFKSIDDGHHASKKE